MMGLGLLIPILFLIALVYFLGWLPQSRRQKPVSRYYDNASDSRPLDVLKERYARGEVTKEEYQEMRRELSA